MHSENILRGNSFFHQQKKKSFFRPKFVWFLFFFSLKSHKVLKKVKRSTFFFLGNPFFSIKKANQIIFEDSSEEWAIKLKFFISSSIFSKQEIGKIAVLGRKYKF